MPDQDIKRCTKCGAVKPLDGFPKDKNRPDGHFPHCKACNSARAKAWYQANSKRAYEWQKARRLQHGRRPDKPSPEQAHAHYLRYRDKYPERLKERRQRWKESNPQKVTEQESRRRARKRNAPVVEKIDRAEIISRDRSICHICKKLVAPAEMSLDHLVPLARGGEHSARNLAVAHLLCNLRRGPGYIPAQLRLT